MRRKSVMLLMLLMLGGWLLGFDPAPAHACSCAKNPSPNIALEQSSAVFSGEVVEIKNLNRPVVPTAYTAEVTFRVLESWKGVRTDNLTVRTAPICGNNFHVGLQYLVYAYETGDVLITGPCTRTAELTKAADDLAALGKGMAPPLQPEESIRSNPAGMALLGAGTALAVLATAVLVYLLLRRQRGREGKR